VVGARRYHAAGRAAWPPSEVHPSHVQHEGLRLLRIVDPKANGDALGSFRLSVPDIDQAIGRGLLTELGVRPDHMLIGVGPGSGRSTTAWPAERFAAVGSALLSQFGNIVLLAIGGSSERRLCDELCAGWGPRSHNLAGRLSVFGSASVLSQCATFIGNDSGPTHLAAMVGIPCVAIFSARNPPGQWQPLGAHHIVLEERPECAGCMLDECVLEAKKCLTRIETGRVVREAVSLIESRGRPCLAH
jgi:ADP-heptose:LPS heptosyltransferase